MSQEISPWAFTQTLRETVCPRCEAKPGERCKTPKGRKVYKPHAERSAFYFLSIGREEFSRRHSVKNTLQHIKL